MADLLFDWFGFGLEKELNPNKINRRSAVQWYFSLQSKLVFSGPILNQAKVKAFKLYKVNIFILFSDDDFYNSLFGCTLIAHKVGLVHKGGLHIRQIYKYKMVRGLTKGVSGGCFILINKWCYVQSAFMYNPVPMVYFLFYLISRDNRHLSGNTSDPYNCLFLLPCKACGVSSFAVIGVAT